MILFRNRGEHGHPLLSVASLRLKKDLEELASNRYTAGYTYISISFPYLQGIYICVPVVFKAKSDPDVIYSNAVFETLIKISPGYPFKPPEMIVVNTVYHPNVDIDTGVISMAILQEKEWKPTMTVNSIIFSFDNLIGDPDFMNIPENSVNFDMKYTYFESINTFQERVRLTMNGGLFLNKYHFLENYGDVQLKKRTKNSCKNSKRARYSNQENDGMSLEVELKNN